MTNDISQKLSPEANESLEAKITRARRHALAIAALGAAKSNDDIILPSHVEMAWNEVTGGNSAKKTLGFAIAASAVLGGVAQAFFGGVGKAIGDWFWHLFQ